MNYVRVAMMVLATIFGLTSARSVVELPSDLSETKLLEMLSAVEGNSFEDNGCRCSRGSCMCCLLISIPDIQLRTNSCIIIMSNPQSPEILAGVLFGRKGLHAIDALNGLPLVTCAQFAWLRWSAVCITFAPSHNDSTSFSSCAILSVFKKQWATFRLGCFTLEYKSADVNNEEMPEDSNRWNEENAEAIFSKETIFMKMKRLSELSDSEIRLPEFHL